MSWFKAAMEKRGAFWVAWKVSCGLCTAGFVMLLYFPIAQLTSGRHHELLTVIDEAIPLLPWTWWIYFPLYLAGILFSLVVLRDERVAYKACIAIGLAQLICVVAYLVYPSSFPRPSFEGGGLSGDALRWFWDFDPPNNTFPSSHVMVATQVALAMWRDRNPLRWIQYASAFGVFVTIHTTKQHYIVDGVAGLAVAIFTHWVVFEWWPGRVHARSYESPNSNV